MSTTTGLRAALALSILAATLQAAAAGGSASDDNAALPRRFTTADVHPSTDQLDASESAQSTALGPQYRISQHATLGGSIEHDPPSSSATGASADRYVFGPRYTF
jgi:hypothetical protein